LTGRKSVSQSRDEIESEVYDKFLSTESLREEDMYQNMFCTSQDRRKQYVDYSWLVITMGGKVLLQFAAESHAKTSSICSLIE
jgi:hypothetical protein